MLQMNPARLAEQAEFDYKSPRILWGAHTRIPAVVGIEAALTEASVPVLFSFLLEALHRE